MPDYWEIILQVCRERFCGVEEACWIRRCTCYIFWEMPYDEQFGAVWENVGKVQRRIDGDAEYAAKVEDAKREIDARYDAYLKKKYPQLANQRPDGDPVIIISGKVVE